uniref:glutathione transferase n=1 Tax=Acrobeloides nanus TaxID=290746 RepID=A0A914CHL3_9BILA
MIFQYAGQKFEDHRVSQQEWPTFKPKTPFGQLPVLEVDGKQLAQSFAVTRYLAKKFGLAGKDDWESAQLDSIADFQKDFENETRKYYLMMAGFASGDKEIAYKEIFNPAAEKHFPVLNKLLKESGSGFFGKSGPSWVDFYISDRVTTYNGFAPEFFKKHPEILAHADRIHNLPQLKDYIKSRKQTHI